MMLHRSTLKSIQLTLPLAVTALLAAAVTAAIVFAYVEVRRTALQAGNDRLERVTKQVSDLLDISTKALKEQLQRQARREALEAYLLSRDAQTKDKALAALNEVHGNGPQVVDIELWDARGTAILAVRRKVSPVPPRVRSQLLATRGDSATVGWLHLVADTPVFVVSAPVVTKGQTLGYLVQRGHLSTSVEAARTLGSLIGNGARVFLGNTTGDVWTDFFMRADPPPQSIEPSRVAQYQRHGADSGSRYGMEKAVPGTPWLLLVEFPRDELMAPVRHFLRNALLITLAVMVLGAVGLWRVTRTITRPIKILQEAATAITEGDYTRRVRLNRVDELGELGLAFNTMAERVARAQLALKRRLASMEDQYHLLVDGIKDYAIFMLDPQGHVVSWNEGASRIKGYRSDEIVGQHFSLFYPAEDVVAHAPWNKLEAARKSGRHEEETWLVRKDGSRIWAHVVITALRDENGELLGFAKITRDISEKRRVAEAEAAHTRALEAAYVDVDRHREELKLANSEMEAFTYSVSHDLRAPIRQIEGFTKMLGEHLGDTIDAESAKYLERVRDGSQQMGRLVDDLLSLAKLGRQDTKAVPMPLTPLVEGVVADVSSEADGRQVEWRIGELPTAVCDPGLMKIVFTNLLSNALKYTRHKPIALIEVGQILDGDRVAIYVRDNGAGFDMKYVDKLFGVFQRLHRADEFEGTGIGLATVLRIIRKHNGTIWAESAVDRGSTFFFTLGTEPVKEVGSYSPGSSIFSVKPA